MIARTDRVLYESPVITVGRVGACGEVHSTAGPAWVSDNALVAIADERLVTLQFLALALEAVDYAAIRGGTNQPLITQTALKEVRFGLPPLYEQCRIVDLVASVDEVDARLREMARTVDSTYGSLVLSTMSRTDVPARALGEVSSSRLGKMLSAASKTGVDEFPYVRNANVQWDEIRLDDLNEMHFSNADRAEFRLRAGDVLICEGGEVGRSAVVSRDIPDVYFQKAIHRVRCAPELLPRYLMHYMRYLALTNGLADYSSQLTIQHLTGEKLRMLPIALPDVEAQDGIVQVLDAAAEVRRAALVGVEAIGAVRVALLADLLSGDHEIPESYDLLLDATA